MLFEAMPLDKLKKENTARVVINDIPVLLAYYQEKVYAINDRCPHLGASLSKGSFKDGIVTCQSHKAEIDIRNGEVMNKAKILFFKMPTKPSKTYVVEIKNNHIFVDL